ncbi:MAG: AAA family ATPase, partial [Chloroflexota bacterium]
MQLREIHVVRFGMLQNVRVSGLASGLNVLYGPNEFGKTSLLEFIRRILFGFPDKRSRLSQYEAPGADKNAGRLVCEFRNGTTVDILRSTGKGGGPLTAATSSGATFSEDEFKAMLGHASSDLYRNVFSLDLADLFETDVTSVPEIRDRLYGAGLGGVWPTEFRGRFETRAEELFKSGGRNQVMKHLADQIIDGSRAIEETRQRLAGYDSKKSESDRLKARERELGALLNRARADLRSREAQVQLYSTVHDMRTAERDLAGMGEVPEVSDETLAELHERQASLRDFASGIENRRNDLTEKRDLLEQITFNQALLERENDIRSLSQRVSRYRSIRQEELPDLDIRAAAARTRLDQRLAALGANWTADRLHTFALTTGQRDSLRQQEMVLKGRSDALENARRKLEMYRDQVIARGADRRAIPAQLRVAGLAVLVLGAAGATIAAMNGQTIAAALSGIAAAVGLIIALLPGPSAGTRQDPMEEQLQSQVQQAEESLLAAENDWSNCLTRVGLSPTLSPEAKDETLRAIDDATRELQGIDELEERIARLRRIIADIDERYREVARASGETPLGADVAAGIELLDTRLAEAITTRARCESLSADIRVLEQRIREHEEEKA